MIVVMVTIRTPDQRVRVFVSSTLQELADERAAVRDAVQRMRLTPVMFEMGARAHPPRDLYRAYLDQSDVFLGIYWQRYGWIAPGETISGLEDEYALAGDRPRLVYIKRAETREPRLNELIGRIQRDDKSSYRPFSDAGELQELVANDLALMLTERFAAAAPVTATQGDAPGEAPPPWLAPIERGDLIGRERLVDELKSLAKRPDVGLVTLTGPGGTGKTRLAVHVAHALGPSFPDGVFYVPLAGVALAIAALIDALLEARAARPRAKPTAGRRRWVVAALALLVYAAWSDVLLSLRMDLRMTSTDWPLDPVLRKSEIARAGIDDTRAILAGHHANVSILIPASISHSVNLGSGVVEADAAKRRYELEEVLDAGRSLKALVPEVDSVAFVHDYEPGHTGWLLLLSRSDSHLVSLGVLPAAHARFVQAMLASRFPAAALDYADKALAGEPADATLRALRGQAAAAAR